MKKIMLIIATFGLTLILSGCGVFGIQFELEGSNHVNISTDTPFVDAGFTSTRNLFNIDDYVTVDGTVDTSTPGDYELTYTLNYNDTFITLTRHVYVRASGCKKLLTETKTDVSATPYTQCTLNYTEYLDTYVSLIFYYEGDNHTILNEIDATVEGYLSTYHNLTTKYDLVDGVTNIKSINDAPETVHTVDQRLLDVITFSLENQDEDHFNIALGPVLNIWSDYRNNCLDNAICEVPELDILTTENAYTNPDNILIDDTLNTIQLDPFMSLDLGGVSKGYVTREIVRYLDTLELSGYLLNNGESNISIGGTHPTRENEKFIVAIKDPTKQNGLTSQFYATIKVGDNQHVVTSGDYQKYYEVDGLLYHHIISGITLMPERYMRSVTIITDDPALADIYSTTLFTMSIEEGLDFVNTRDDLEAIWYGIDGTITFSDQFESLYLDYLDEAYIN